MARKKAKRKYTRRPINSDPTPTDVNQLREWIATAPTRKLRAARQEIAFEIIYAHQQKEDAKRQAEKIETYALHYCAGPKDVNDFAGTDSASVNSQTNPKTLMGVAKVPVLSVVPPASIIAQAIAMRYGAHFAPKADGTRGYGPYNWRDQPIEAHVYIDAAMRHLMQWWDGDDYENIRDEQGDYIDQVSHLAFALATIGILIDAQANNTLIDNRPKVRQCAATDLLNNHKIHTKVNK